MNQPIRQPQVDDQEVSEGKQLICSHCGDPCEDRKIRIDTDFFCCHGCKTVFEILHENGLEAYYNIEKEPGISLKKSRPNDYYDFLDNEEIRRKILDFDSPDLSKVHFYIPSIHCSSCIWLLENLHTLATGVEGSRVNFPKREVAIDFNPAKLSLRALVELLGTLGYDPEISLDKLERGEDLRSRYSRKLLTKLGVAGFAFGNIMLFSFPEYLGFDELFDTDFRRFFGYINLLFALPILFYCSTEYFSSAWKGIKQKYVNIDVPISLGILTLFIRSSYEVISFTGPGYFDSLAGLLFFLLLGKWFQNRTYESLLFDRNYKSYFPIAITRRGANGVENVTIDELKEGDRIVIRNNELIPADSILISEKALIDNSFVTGESEPIPYQKDDYIYAGGKHKGEVIELEVRKEVSQSYLTQLWNKDAFSKDDEISTHILVNRISKYFTATVILIAITTGIVWFFIDSNTALNAFTAVLIVACPCALALATPFTTGNAMRILGKNGFFIRNGDVIEKLAETSRVVFDKTGTVTLQSEGLVEFSGDLSVEEQSMIRSLAQNSTHPLSRKLIQNIDPVNKEESVTVDHFEEKPGEGISGLIDGHKILLGSKSFTGALSNGITKASLVYVNINDKDMGFFSISNNYRKGFEEVARELEKNYQIDLLSGDNEADKEYLNSILPEGSNLKFNQSPYSKLETIKKWQGSGDKIVMFGDGLNDAGALAQSNVGVAVTDEIGSFTPASDVIQSGKSFSLIPSFLKFSKNAKKVIIMSFIISFLYNITGLSFAVSGKLDPLFAAILMPLSSISVVVFATAMVNLFARSLKLQL